MFKQLLFLMCFAVISVSGIVGQEITITDPGGLTPPYEINQGSLVEVTWDYFGSAPDYFYTHPEEPVLDEFFPNPEWERHENYVDNGDGTFSFTFTLDEDTYVWAGSYQSFLGRWAYSNVIYLQMSSGLEIEYETDLLCPGGMDSILLSVQDTFEAYQWYKNNEAIDGAVSHEYEVSSEGSYKVWVDAGTDQLFSNAVSITTATLSIIGEFNHSTGELVLSAGQDYAGYTWLSGSDPDSLQAIPGEINKSLTLALDGEPTFYGLSAEHGTCLLQASPRQVIPENFILPEIHVQADTNAHGVLCTGTEIELSTDEIYASYNWYQDGNKTFGDDFNLFIYAEYQTGVYKVIVHPMDWPEVNLESEEIEVSYFTVQEPVLSGVDFYGNFCPGESITVILSDEGYDYTWYMHEGYNYSETDIIDVDNNTLEFDYEDNIFITVKAEYKGCSSETTVNLNSYSSLYLGIMLDDYNKQYLCDDSTSIIYVPQETAELFSSLQWYKNVEGEEILLDGETRSQLHVHQPGSYLVKGVVAACPSVEVASFTQDIYSFTDRSIFIYADMPMLCEGDTTELHISGGSEWRDIQWFEGNVTMTQEGYAREFTPIIGAGNKPDQAVTDYNIYTVKARHVSCPTGKKITSNEVAVTPSINPRIEPLPNDGINKWHIGIYGDIPNYLYCEGQELTLTLGQDYDKVEWYAAMYAGDGKYELGEKLDHDSDSLQIIATAAYWYTAKLWDGDCIGYSSPVVIDTKVYQNPAIASYNNAELCEPGDSTMIHIAFQHNYGRVEWFKDGEYIPDSDKDTMWVKETGEYVVVGYPEDCPDVGFSSGMGPYITFLEATIEENDTLIYAMPELGNYEYQWYRDGVPIEGGPVPWILLKEDMEPGIYTVEVTNPEPCTSLSEEYIWRPTATAQPEFIDVTVFPNPAHDIITVKGEEGLTFVQMTLYNSLGQVIKTVENSRQLNIEGCSDGLYIIGGKTHDNRQFRKKILIQKP